MQARHHPPIILVVGLLASAVAMTMAARSARAHGDAEWIMAEPRYVDANGIHCCGPSDCGRAPAEAFTEMPDGISVISETGTIITFFSHDRIGRGAYVSKDDDWWWCRSFGRVRCIFKPTTGG